MFYTEPYHLQKGAGVFEVDRYPLQRGRGLGGIFANLLRKIIPYGKTFAKAAASTGKKVLQSDIGKDILNDTISTAATAATTALLENNPKEAKAMLLDSFKRSGHKSKDVVKKIAKNKLDQVLTGRG
ncbi:MAG TPA: hypothetical protein DDE71_02175, partial [Tenacibaculum sp.]|nr:hypothetical protein [Tenacibaculum sp.]